MIKTNAEQRLASDVLASAVRAAGQSSSDLRAIRAWLAEQLVAQEHAKLGQGGHTNTQVPLRQVFVDLPIVRTPGESSLQEDRMLFLSSLLSGTPVNFQNTFRTSVDHTPVSKGVEQESEQEGVIFNDSIEDAHSRALWGATLLIGGPGQGKSTLGQLACQLHRAALIHPVLAELTTLQRDIVNSFIPRSSEEETESPQVTPLGLPTHSLIPLQVTLPDFAEWAAKSSVLDPSKATPSLIQFLAETPSARGVGLDASKLFDLICELPSLLVLDGFDEVGATQDRQRIVAAAQELFSALSERSAYSQILATTRPQGYADELSKVGITFQKVFLAPLSKEDALEYAVKLIEAKILGADQQAKAHKKILEAAADPATERLLTTPLQVTILTALVQQLGRAPRERWNLFHRYFTYTYDREIERNTYASSLLLEYRSHIERIHAQVALLLQVEAERDGGASARMPKERLEQVIFEVLAEDEVAKDQRKDLVREIASAAENRLVFLVEPEPGKFGFEIRSLQEFMAAWALTSGRDTEVETRLHQVSKAPMFRNVTLFICSRLFSDGSPLRDILADRICRNLNEDSTDELSRLSCAGSLLALETLEEGAALSQPKRARGLMKQAISLLSLPASYEHIRLARVVNQDTLPVLIDALEDALRPSTQPTSFYAPSAWTCLIDAINRNEPWAIELGDHYWVHNSASSELLGALNRAYVPLGEWICKKLDANAETFSPDSFLDAYGLRGETSPQTSWTSWLIDVYGTRSYWRSRNYEGFTRTLSPNTQRFKGTQPNYPPPKSAIWRAWIAAAKFECDPTAENLSVGLEELLKAKDLTYWKRQHWRFSWPLQACINYANDSFDVERIVAQLRTDLLGDKTFWAKIEKGWNRTLTFDSLRELSVDGPWSKESLKIAPPLFAQPIWRFLDQFNRTPRRTHATKNLPLINDIFLSSKSPALRKKLAEISLAQLRNLPTRAKLSNFDIKRWVESTTDSATLLIPRPKAISVSQWKELLDAFDVKKSYPFILEPEPLFESLLELPSHPVLLRLATRTIGIYATHDPYRIEFVIDDMEKVIGAIETLGENLPRFLDADLAILKLCVGTFPASQDEHFFTSISMACETEPEKWNDLLGALKISRLPRNRIERLLSNIYSTMSREHIYANGVINQIRHALQKRTSDLDSHTTWDRLALPLPYPRHPLQPRMEGGIPSKPVHIRNLEVQDIGGVRKLNLELTQPVEGKGQWVVIIGPNGSGKTTLLRSLALSLRSVKHPSIWPKGAFGSTWLRTPDPGEGDVSSSHIRVTLGDGVEHRTLIRASNSLSITQLPEQEHPRLFPLFAYGCRRGSALGGAARQVNLSDEDGPEIATLFDEGADLIQAETWLVALEGDISKNPKSKIIYECVIEALKLLMKLESVEVFNQRLWVVEAGKARVPFSCLSDGYLTNAGWFLDLIARWIKLAERHSVEINTEFLSNIRGLVLIDEIDLHLHPQWQTEIIARTRSLLPSMSFVVTTHNPLTLVGANADEIWILDRKSESVTAISGVETPMLMTGGQIYRQYFGIKDIYPNTLGRILQRYSYLSGYSLRNDDEQAELEELHRKLDDAGLDPGWEIVSRDLQDIEQSQSTIIRTKNRQSRDSNDQN